MLAYTLRRILLIIPTIIGIMAISFVIVQFAPGGPIERIISQINGSENSALSRVSGGYNGDFSQSTYQNSDISSKYRGSQGLDPEFILELEKQFGFDKPPLERFFQMISNYMRFDFGDSYYRDIKVIDLIVEKLPVSISLGLWMTLISYLISIPLGMLKAIKDGSKFDVWTSTLIVLSYALPGFLVAIFLIIFFAGGSYLDWFPLRGLTSDNFSEMNFYEQILDYFWKCHDPTQLNRQGPDVGRQYRSVIFYYSESQKKIALQSKILKQKSLKSLIVTEICSAKEFYLAESYHQLFIHKKSLV